MSDVHPLDFEALRKGDVIDREQIERIYNTRYSRDPDAFRLHALKLREQIEENRSDLVVRIRGTTLEILTDQQAEEHTVERHAKLVKATGRNVKRRARIDRAGFTQQDQQRAESWDRAMTATALLAQKQLRDEQRKQLLLAAPKPDEEPQA